LFQTKVTLESMIFFLLLFQSHVPSIIYLKIIYISKFLQKLHRYDK